MNSTQIAERVKFYEDATRRHMILSAYDGAYVNNFTPIRNAGRAEVALLWTDFLKKNTQALLSLYINIPFCKGSKCSYCMYNSFPLVNPSEMDVYLDDMEENVRFFSPLFEGHPFSTLYVGGGTPSIMSKRQLGRLFALVFDNFTFRDPGSGSKCLEISPSTFTKDKISLAKDRGIDRISMGVQSLDPGVLKACNRRKTSPDRLRKIVAFILSQRFLEFNADLMAWLPGDSVEKFLYSFGELARMGVPSITVYFYRHEPAKGSFYGYSYPYERRDLLRAVSALIKKEGFPFSASINELSEHQVFHNSRRNPRLTNPTEYFDHLENSTFALGTFARSFIKNSVSYVRAGFPVLPCAREAYLLKEFPRSYQMSQYVLKELEQTGRLSLARFRQTFKEDFRDVFKNELNCLFSLKKVAIRQGCAVFLSRDVFDFSVYSKFFYDQQSLKKAVASLK